MKKYTIIFLVLLVSCIIGTVMFLLDNPIQEEDEKIVKWMIKESSVYIPSSAELKYVSHQESLEIAMYSLKKEDLKDFIKKNELQKITLQDFGIFITQNLEGHTLNPKDDFYYIGDYKPGIKWDLLLDPRNGNLWFGVIHIPKGDK